MQNASERALSIQAVRGIAATLVMIWHTVGMAASGGNTYAGYLLRMLNPFGGFGVDLFFVISGFIMMGCVRRASDTPGHFLLKRGVRIYPILWLSVAAILAAQSAFGTGYEQAVSGQSMNSLLLLEYNPANPASWTLVYEMQFYIACAIAFCFGRYAVRALLVLAALLVVMVLAAHFWQMNFYIQAFPISLEFVLGIGLGYLAPRLSRRAAWAAVLTGCAILVIAAPWPNPIMGTQSGFLRLAVWGSAATLIIWGFLSFEWAGWRPRRALTFLGDISYSIYLWHLPIVMGIAWLLGHSLIRTAVIGVYLISVPLLTFLVSWASYRWIERPTNAWAAGLRSRPSPVGVPTEAAA